MCVSQCLNLFHYVLTFESAGKDAQKENGRQNVGKVKRRLSSLVLVSEALTGREIDHWSMTARYDPTPSCSMLSVE